MVRATRMGGGSGGGGGSGTVTSVALAMPAIFSVAGSPVTTAGTITVTLATETANTVFAGPTTGAAAAPTFRALVAADYPTMVGDSGAGGTKGAVPAPAAGDAAAGKFLSADGTWAAPAGGGGANTALSNLAAVAVNTSLVSDTDNTDDLGSAAKAWKDVYLAGSLAWNGSAGAMKLGSTQFCAVASDDLRFKATYGVGLYANLADSNPVAQLQAAALLFGAGGASAVDCSITRASANVFKLGDGDRLDLGENASVGLDESLSADGKYTGITIEGTAGTALAFGDVVYLAVADSRWELLDADAASTSGDVLPGICVLAAAGDGSATRILLYGTIRADAAFPTLTVGAPVYASTTAGDVQVAQPSGTDDVIRVLGFALTADSFMFNPSPDYITHT